MNSPTTKHVIRMGPVTVLSLVIVLSLATMAVLSFATAQAATRLVDKQQAAQQMLYDNERAAQEFVSQVDEVLAQARDLDLSYEEGLANLAAALNTEDIVDAADDANAVKDTHASNKEAEDEKPDEQADGAEILQDNADEEIETDGLSNGGLVVDGPIVSKSFTEGTRTLTVKLFVSEDLRYAIQEWKTEASLDSTEETSLWMG